MFGIKEILIIALIVLILFGGTKIPKLMKGIGQGIHEFKKGVKGDESESQS
ncbi:MAG: twin-arginine translocase TatA/TatE family subunit [Bacteroidetes bacterium]|nr:MAG: twin-arginine translocase TatA/TatE family subunit [Bacteroidota bacterium]REK00813.1 MAG: twin-arginine translocase TatA/TatE family subunit [Bacteroidota bacterium]REK35053.1 MAG: twin-arginine translocase TatA/TatE family subunit [Bacteroidota bacterium]REK48370.1 MAG: twin-arginine translocase TatA/TatE family subunit [Bacteroidota bacterium]